MKANLRKADGLRWIDRGPSTDDHLSFTGHEHELAEHLYALADPSAWYVNVGAHVGTWALRMADKASRVFAIEANRSTYDVLYLNVITNGLLSKVVPMYEAAWDENGVPLILMDAQGKESGGSTRVQKPTFTRGIEILSKKLDTIFPPVVNSTERIGLIQLDVEGAEAKVLRGAREILATDRPNLLIELHEGHPGTDPDLREQVYDILRENSYSFDSLKVAGTEEHIVATPN